MSLNPSRVWLCLDRPPFVCIVNSCRCKVSWGVVLRDKSQWWWGGISESQLVRVFYFYAPSCPEGAGCPSLPSSQPSMRQGVCLEWILGGWEHLGCCCCWVEIGGDAPRPLVLRCIVWMNEALMRNKHIDWSTLAVNISCSLWGFYSTVTCSECFEQQVVLEDPCAAHGSVRQGSFEATRRSDPNNFFYIHSSLIYPRWWIFEVAMGEN